VYTLLGFAALPGVIVFMIVIYNMLYEWGCIYTNTDPSTTSSVAKWRQQQAYMIQSSYREGSTLKRCAIDAYLKKKCYIQVLQPVDKHTSTAATATKVETFPTASTGYTVNSITQADLDCIKADVTALRHYKVLQLLTKLSCETDGSLTFNSVTFKLGAVTFIALMVAEVAAESLWFY
jgi:hypothetical protein